MTKITHFILLSLIALATLLIAVAGRDPVPTAAQEATPVPQFGPVVGSDYTPPPPNSSTNLTVPPLADDITALPCTLTVTAPQVALYAQADANSGGIGVAYTQEALAVSEIRAGTDGREWAQTASGWLPLTDGSAVLAERRACAVLRGDLPPTANIGLHVITPTGSEAVLNFVRKLAQAGYPVNTIKGLSGTENLLNEIKQISPQTTIVYRSYLSSDGYGDCPADVRDLPDPIATARRWMDGLEPYWDAVNADYYEYINECPVGHEWLTGFSIAAMQIANERGRCLLLYSFAGGTPDVDQMDVLLPAYQFAAENECQPGRHHGIALHAYSMEDKRLVSETNEWLSLRHRKMVEVLQTTYPPGAELPVYITELGIGGGQVFPGCDAIVRDAVQYMYLLEDDPYVHGFHLWSVGAGTQWYDITPCLPALADAVLTYYGAPAG